MIYVNEAKFHEIISGVPTTKSKRYLKELFRLARMEVLEICFSDRYENSLHTDKGSEYVHVIKYLLHFRNKSKKEPLSLVA
jgi:hypothetical protein